MHMIRQQSVEVTFDGLEDAMGIQNHISDLYHTQLLPRMEDLFDELFGPGHHVAIDRLEIDCGSLDKKNWDREFVEQALRQLRIKLLEIPRTGMSTAHARRSAAERAFLHYLQYGNLPWDSHIRSIAEMEGLLEIDEQLVRSVRVLVRSHIATAGRLVSRFSKEMIDKIMPPDAIAQYAGTIRLLAEQLTRPLEGYMRDTVLLYIFSSVGYRFDSEPLLRWLHQKGYTGPGSVHSIAGILAVIAGSAGAHHKGAPQAATAPQGKAGEPQIPGAPSCDDIYSEQARDTGEDIYTEDADAVYISHAGLILLHPFLPALFAHMGLWAEDSWAAEGQHDAVALLYYLSTGLSEAEEFDLTLEKVLCGMQPEDLAVQRPLSDAARAECDTLLAEVIGHWSVLKNTTPAGLREAFLQRSGKLTRTNEGWLLQVEQKAIDILLGHLPWGIGLVKLPWMNDMIYVEWA